jgi:hypothetical protein
MNTFTTTPNREVIATVQYLPAVSIIMPFAPIMTPRKNLEYRLKNIMGKAEALLAAHYTAEKAIPVIIKLKNIIAGLNYNSTKKSVAIFLSPVVEKVYYFEAEMEEKVMIDPSFKFSDLVGCKKEKKEYLILLLSEQFSKMYLCNGTQLRLIKSNTLLVNSHEYKTKASEEMAGFSTLPDQQQSEDFLHQMDQGLSIILRSYPLPVVVTGTEKLLRYFRKITTNEESLLQFIHDDYDEDSACELNGVTESIVSCWEKLKKQHLLKQLENAKAQNRLRTGMQDTLKAAIQNKGRLLVVEKKLINPGLISKTYHPFAKINSAGNEVFFIKNDLDNIIKKVFENGGEVEFIDNGLLKNYGHIALIENY